MAVTHNLQPGGQVREDGSPQGGLIAQQGKFCFPITTLFNQIQGADLDFFFVNSEILGKQIWRGENASITKKIKLQQNSVNQIFNPRAFFFLLLTGAT